MRRSRARQRQTTRLWCLTSFIKQKHIFLKRNLHQSRLLDPSPQAVTHTHREFVYGLLSECRLKVSSSYSASVYFDGWEKKSKNSRIFSTFFCLFRPSACWWRGWGRRTWSWVMPALAACRKTRSSTVCVTCWREPGATVCRWSRSDTWFHKALRLLNWRHMQAFGNLTTQEVNDDKCVWVEQGKSALWSHLVHHQAAQGKMEAPAESPGLSRIGPFCFLRKLLSLTLELGCYFHSELS